MLAALVESLRPRQWTKNLLLFAPLLFAQKLGDGGAAARALAAFAIFCLLSGAVYLFNDLRDVDSDRRHPVKRDRPLAGGRLAPVHAKLGLAVTLGLGLGGAGLLSPELVTRPSPVVHGHATTDTQPQPSFSTMAVAYVLLHAAYSTYLKHVVILDALTIALGFVVRAMAGAAVIAVNISHWLFICTIFLSLFLALAKRRAEIVLLEGEAENHRPALAQYDGPLLDQMIGIVASACVISYALYTTAPETIGKFETDRLSYTIPFVIYGLFRYLYLIHRRADGGDPAASLLADRPLLAAVTGWALAVFAVLYL